MAFQVGQIPLGSLLVFDECLQIGRPAVFENRLDFPQFSDEFFLCRRGTSKLVRFRLTRQLAHSGDNPLVLNVFGGV